MQSKPYVFGAWHSLPTHHPVLDTARERAPGVVRAWPFRWPKITSALMFPVVLALAESLLSVRASVVYGKSVCFMPALTAAG